MADRPLGIADLIPEHHGGNLTGLFPIGHWYWCRRHEQSHKVGEACWCKDCPLERGPHHPDTDCIDIGPFMSENEANRLSAIDNYWPTHVKPLGMEVEL